MKRLFALSATLLTALPSYAGSPPLVPAHVGYAFDHPRTLVQQRLFGLAHGVALLAAACVREPEYRETLTLAYAEWREQQKDIIETNFRDLAQYHFGDRAAEADPLDVARALKLKDRLALKSGSPELRAACESFVPALTKPRLDLRRQYRLQMLASRLASATITEARATACRNLLSDDANAQLETALSTWRQSYGDNLGEAETTLAQQWPEMPTGDSLQEWRAQARETGKKSASVNICTAMPQWLATSQANPDDEFAPERRP